MGMDSKKLSARKKQPGHDQSFRASEGNFALFLKEVLNPDVFDIVEKPRALAKMLPNPGVAWARDAYGVVPEVVVVCKQTGRAMFFEVKKQGRGGNADERACKHHTIQFQKRLREFTGYNYHAMVTIMCEQLATYPKYVAKHPYFFEPDSYFCWEDYDDTSALTRFVERVLRETVVDDSDARVLA